MGSARRLLLCALFTLPPLTVSTEALAQIGVSATLDSDYRVRGFSLSSEKPALSLDFNYDHDSGAYIGASVVATETHHSGVGLLAYVADAGYAAPIGGGASWDGGVTYTTIDTNTYKRHSQSYAEIYSGLTYGDVKAYVYYAPDYLGQGVDTVYLDIAASYRLAPRWRLFGHVGALTPVGGGSAPDARHEQYDLRAGAAFELGRGQLRLAWDAASPYAEYPVGHLQARDALVFQAAYFF